MEKKENKNTPKDFIPSDEEAVHTPNLSHGNFNVTIVIGNEEEGVHEQFPDLASETKPILNLSHENFVVTTMIGEEKEKGEIVSPIEEKDLSIEGSVDFTFNGGGFDSMKKTFAYNIKSGYTFNNGRLEHHSPYRPESGNFGFRRDPDPKLPDDYFSPPQIRSHGDSSIIPITTERREVFGTVSSKDYSLKTKKINWAQIQPDPQLGQTQGSLATKLRPSLRLTTLSVFIDQSFDLQGNKSVRSYEAGYGDTRSEKAEAKGSTNMKIEGSYKGMNGFNPLENVGSTMKEQFPATNVQEMTSLMGKLSRTGRIRTSLSPPFVKLNHTLNQSLTLLGFSFRPNLNLKPSSNLESEIGRLFSSRFSPFYFSNHQGTEVNQFEWF